MRFQTVTDRKPSRADHIWFRSGDWWKCCLCGAITRDDPPACPTPKNWLPTRYVTLTDTQRALAPFDKGGF